MQTRDVIRLIVLTLCVATATVGRLLVNSSWVIVREGLVALASLTALWVVFNTANSLAHRIKAGKASHTLTPASNLEHRVRARGFIVILRRVR